MGVYVFGGCQDNPIVIWGGWSFFVVGCLWRVSAGGGLPAEGGNPAPDECKRGCPRGAKWQAVGGCECGRGDLQTATI